MRRARSRTVMAAEPSYYGEGIKEGEKGGAAKRGIWLMILQDLGREEEGGKPGDEREEEAYPGGRLSCHRAPITTRTYLHSTEHIFQIFAQRVDVYFRKNTIPFFP